MDKIKKMTVYFKVRCTRKQIGTTEIFRPNSFWYRCEDFMVVWNQSDDRQALRIWVKVALLVTNLFLTRTIHFNGHTPNPQWFQL